MRKRWMLCGVVLCAFGDVAVPASAATSCPSATVATASPAALPMPTGVGAYCFDDPCPVIQRDGITYYPLTFEDNEIKTAIVGYDAQKKQQFRIDKAGARYISSIDLDCAAGTATLVGQGGAKITLSLSELKPGASTAAPTTAPTPTTPPKPPTNPSIPERLAKSDIMAVLLANKPAIVNCVKEQKKKDPGLSGQLVMRWTIQMNGKTKGVTVKSTEHAKTYMATCISGLIKGWTFPQHKKQGDPIEHPFTF